MKEYKSGWNIGMRTKSTPTQNIFETFDGKFLVHFYSVKEYGVLKYCSPVQIWTGKENPILIMDSKQVYFEFQFDRSIEYLRSAQILCLLYPKIHNTQIDLWNVVIDLQNKLFAKLDAINFEFIDLANHKFRLKFNPRYRYSNEQLPELSKREGEIISLKDLAWTPLSQLQDLLPTTSNRDCG